MLMKLRSCGFVKSISTELSIIFERSTAMTINEKDGKLTISLEGNVIKIRS